jgi:small redox-active disulfide protein 2
VRKAVEELGIEATVNKVKDMAKIMEYGIMMTPGLVVDGEVKAAGRVPKVDEIKGYLISKK